jgi:hypothetical protein
MGAPRELPWPESAILVILITGSSGASWQKANTRDGGSHAQDFHPFRSGVRLGDDGHCDGRDDRRDLGLCHSAGDPLNVLNTSFLSSYLVLVMPGALVVLLAVLLWTER